MHEKKKGWVAAVRSDAPKNQQQMTQTFAEGFSRVAAEIKFPDDATKRDTYVQQLLENMPVDSMNIVEVNRLLASHDESSEAYACVRLAGSLALLRDRAMSTMKDMLFVQHVPHALEHANIEVDEKVGAFHALTERLFSSHDVRKHLALDGPTAQTQIADQLSQLVIAEFQAVRAHQSKGAQLNK